MFKASVAIMWQEELGHKFQAPFGIRVEFA